MKTIGVAVIGAGQMGKGHLNVYRHLPNVGKTAVFDVDSARASNLARDMNSVLYEDLDGILLDADIGAVSVCTNEDTHFELVRACLEAGKHVLVEKPLATTVEHCLELERVAKKAKRLLMTGYTLRFDSRYHAAKMSLDNGKIGEVQYMTLRRGGKLKAHRYLNGRASLPMFLGVHDYDLARWYTNSEVRSVWAKATYGIWSKFASQRVADTVVAVLEFESGVVATVESNWILPDGMVGFDFKADLLGEAGAIELSCKTEGVTLSTSAGAQSVTNVLAGEVYGVPSGALFNELNHFVHAVVGTTKLAISPFDGTAAVQIASAVEESIESGNVISL